MFEASSDVALRGFSSVPGLLGSEEVEILLHAFSALECTPAIRQRGGIYAIRNLLSVVPAVASLARSPSLTAMVADILGTGAIPVRGILFDKTLGANWLVPWHQDLTICVQDRVEVAGYGPWNVKAGVHHVQPPAHVLQAMLAVRLHLDDCMDANGPLRVLPGTHLHGRLSAAEIEEKQRTISAVTCCVAKGGVLLMKPLLLHASLAAESPGHRRVIHLEFAVRPLPAALKWASHPTP